MDTSSEAGIDDGVDGIVLMVLWLTMVLTVLLLEMVVLSLSLSTNSLPMYPFHP
jgi:hypothetical protein